MEVVAELGKQTKQTGIAFDRRTNGRTPAFDHRNWHHISAKPIQNVVCK